MASLHVEPLPAAFLKPRKSHMTHKGSWVAQPMFSANDFEIQKYKGLLPASLRMPYRLVIKDRSAKEAVRLAEGMRVEDLFSAWEYCQRVQAAHDGEADEVARRRSIRDFFKAAWEATDREDDDGEESDSGAGAESKKKKASVKKAEKKAEKAAKKGEGAVSPRGDQSSMRRMLMKMSRGGGETVTVDAAVVGGAAKRPLSVGDRLRAFVVLAQGGFQKDLPTRPERTAKNCVIAIALCTSVCVLSRVLPLLLFIVLTLFVNYVGCKVVINRRKIMKRLMKRNLTRKRHEVGRAVRQFFGMSTAKEVEEEEEEEEEGEEEKVSDGEYDEDDEYDFPLM